MEMMNPIMKASSLLTACALVFLGSIASALPAEAAGAAKTQPTVKSAKPLGGAGLGDVISVTVVGAPEFRQEALGRQLVLFLDGIPLKSVHPDYNDLDDHGDGELRFFIEHTEEPIARWTYFITSQGLLRSNPFEYKVRLSVGVADQRPIATEVPPFTLVLARENWFIGAVLIVAGLFLLFLVLAVKTALLRETGPEPPAGQRRPYSLARVQMAVWTMAILMAWMLLYVLRHSMDTIPASLVTLLGISAGTGFAATQVGDSALRGGPTVSRGFLLDVLSTEAGVTFHRFQMLAFTVVMVAVFCRQAISYMTMPEFPPTLLTLMGISSATYVGFKFTEQPRQTPGVAPSPPPAASA